MAELSEVESILVTTIAQAVYPDGTAAGSIVSAPVKVSRGWPTPANLDADLKAGIVRISVFPLPQERNVTRYPTDWQELPQPPVELTLAVAGNTVTVGGFVACPLNAAVLVNGKAFIYPLQATDTLTGVATALATLIGSPATSSGPVITVPGAAKLETRVGVVGSVVQEIRRQQKSFRVTLWCPTPTTRDAAACVVDAALAALSFLTLPDGTSGRIRYERTQTEDGSQKAGLYRRDLIYSVEYATTAAQIAPSVVTQAIHIAGGADPAAATIETVNI